MSIGSSSSSFAGSSNSADLSTTAQVQGLSADPEEGNVALPMETLRRNRERVIEIFQKHRDSLGCYKKVHDELASSNYTYEGVRCLIRDESCKHPEKFFSQKTVEFLGTKVEAESPLGKAILEEYGKNSKPKCSDSRRISQITRALVGRMLSPQIGKEPIGDREVAKEVLTESIGIHAFSTKVVVPFVKKMQDDRKDEANLLLNLSRPMPTANLPEQDLEGISEEDRNLIMGVFYKQNPAKFHSRYQKTWETLIKDYQKNYRLEDLKKFIQDISKKPYDPEMTLRINTAIDTEEFKKTILEEYGRVSKTVHNSIEQTARNLVQRMKDPNIETLIGDREVAEKLKLPIAFTVFHAKVLQVINPRKKIRADVPPRPQASPWIISEESSESDADPMTSTVAIKTSSYDQVGGALPQLSTAAPRQPNQGPVGPPYAAPIMPGPNFYSWGTYSWGTYPTMMIPAPMQLGANANLGIKRKCDEIDNDWTEVEKKFICETFL